MDCHQYDALHFATSLGSIGDFMVSAYSFSIYLSLRHFPTPFFWFLSLLLFLCFSEEGNSAVSTIEAIAHAAQAAGDSQQCVSALTTLFQVQRYRVLSSMNSPLASEDNVVDGKVRSKKPRAVAVAGTPGTVGDWTRVEGYCA